MRAAVVRLVESRPHSTTLTNSERILVAALDLGDSWTRQDLAVAAWRRWPVAFGLRGYDLPDASGVYAKIAGETGLVARGLVAQTADTRFALTSRGREAARKAAER